MSDCASGIKSVGIGNGDGHVAAPDATRSEISLTYNMEAYVIRHIATHPRVGALWAELALGGVAWPRAACGGGAVLLCCLWLVAWACWKTRTPLQWRQDDQHRGG